MKINKSLVPIKAHYFFFMAAMGPILPQINVFGKELGISPQVMGYVTCIMPILYVIAKPAVGFLADYFSNHRKLIFMSIIILMVVSYSGYLFIPQPPSVPPIQLIVDQSKMMNCEDMGKLISEFRSFECTAENISIALNLSESNLPEILSCYSNATEDLIMSLDGSELSCIPSYVVETSIYSSWTFWSFVILTYLGTIGYNVANCVSDAVCFDMLGDQTMKYGAQRVWGTIGFGVTALISGYAVDMYTDPVSKSHNFTPAILMMLAFCSFDIFSIKKLKLPKLSSSESILKDVKDLVKDKKIALFLVFATIAGIIDSFIIYYMFWHLEEVAEATGYMHQIKLIEGWVIAAECLGGEILFFLISGKILKRLGYVHCLSFCFFAYSIRLGLISIITNPWYLVPIEFVAQGATYALTYTCIVAYASAIAPPGTSATVQGIVAGMDDGLGFSIGSMIGGIMFQNIGGKISFRIFSIGALITCVAHIFLRPASKHETQESLRKQYDDDTPVDQRALKDGLESKEVTDFIDQDHETIVVSEKLES